MRLGLNDVGLVVVFVCICICGGIFNLDGHAQIKKCPHVLRGFYMLQSSHWHGPCTSDDTLPFGWLKKEAALFAAFGFFPRLGIAGYEPKCYGAWVNSALCAAMDRRRRQLRETADERLDRLIAMERNSRISSPVPEVRRLMVEEGRAAASSPGTPT